MKVLIGFILLWATATATQLEIAGRIWNGNGADKGQFSYMVLIKTKLGKQEGLSSGSLISGRWVLTCAHSLQKPASFYIHIFLGMTYIDDAEIGYALWSPDVVHIHPLFNRKTGQGDIALIEIPDTPLCANIIPVRLPSLNSPQQNSNPGSIGFLVGWGKTGDNSGVPVQLQFGRTKIIQNDVCRAYKPSMSINHICVDGGKDYSSICAGDSGGPFVLESTGELVGIISSKTDRSCEGYPSILTRVTTYLHWIKSTTGVYY